MEGKKFKVDSFSDLKGKVNSSYPDPWLVGVTGRYVKIHISSKSEGVISVEAL